MADKNLTLKLLLQAKDTMSGVVKSACTLSDAEFDKMQRKLEETAGKFDSAGKKLAVFGGALTAVSGVNVKLAGDFQESMNNVSTLIDTDKESLEAMTQKVLEIGKDSPKALNDLAAGLYSIRSAGVSADDQFNVLKGSEKLAVAGLATTAEAVDLTTSAINAFNLKGEEQNRIYDTFNKVVRYGKTNVSDFAQGFGNVAGVMASANIKIDEYSAAVSAMTTNGMKAATAHTQLQAVVAGLTRSGKEQEEVFNRLGAKSFKDLMNKSGGLVNALNKINETVGGNETAILSMIGSIRAYNAVMALTSSKTNAKYLEALEDMRYGADSLDEAYAKQTAGFNNQMRILTNNMQALGIKFGNALLPLLSGAAGAIRGVIDLMDRMPQPLTNFLSIATAGVGVLTLFGGTALIVTANILRSLKTINIALRGFSIAQWANPALLPIIGITAAIAGLAAGVVFCYKKFEGFREICKAAWAVIKAGGAWLAVLWQSFITGAAGVWNFIKPAVKFAAVILSWTTPIGLVIRGLVQVCKWIGQLTQKAGGFRAIGKNIQKWAGEQTTVAQDAGKIAKNNRRIDGSHASGLDYVPFDGYTAELHKGESVLTAPEADRWRSSQNAGSSLNLQIDFKPSVTINSGSVPEKEDFLKMLNQYKDELVRIITTSLARETARAYA